ncbi:MAG: hypothetical protein V4812_22890, partial [Pseudomonadota bacterium]
NRRVSGPRAVVTLSLRFMRDFILEKQIEYGGITGLEVCPHRSGPHCARGLKTGSRVQQNRTKPNGARRIGQGMFCADPKGHRMTQMRLRDLKAADLAQVVERAG